MSLDELLGLALTLYVLVSIVAGVLRGGSRTRPSRPEEETEGEGLPRSWEEELREIFGDIPRPAPGETDDGHSPSSPSRDHEAEERDDRPWLEIEPIPPFGIPFPLPPEEEVLPPPETPPPSAPPPPAAPEPVALEPVVGAQGADRPAVHREPALEPEAPPAFRDAGPPAESLAARVRRRLRAEPASLREVIMLQEILQPPRALRPYRPPIRM